MLNLKDLENGNSFSRRDTTCEFGGKKLEINITHPETIIAEPGISCDVVTGVDLILRPYVPSQLGRARQYLTPTKRVKAEFVDGKPIRKVVNIVPEYSYEISGSFCTTFGCLTQNEAVDLPGEFELMMKKVGCYIRLVIFLF